MQDAAGDTPLMQAIRSHDCEITDLLMHYQPDLLLLNTNNHSAATEAALANDADRLPAVLVRDDPLQVAQSLRLSTKLNKRRVLNRFVELLGAPAVDEMGRGFLNSPLSYIEPGSRVAMHSRRRKTARTSVRSTRRSCCCRKISAKWTAIESASNGNCCRTSTTKICTVRRKSDCNLCANRTLAGA